MDRRHLPDFSRLASGREATGNYRDDVQGAWCRKLYKRPEAQRECIERAMAQEAEYARDLEEKARQEAARAAARRQPTPGAVDRAVHASVAVATSAYENGKRDGELKGRMDVVSNQRALLEELASIATLQELANSDNFLGDSAQRAELVRRLRAAVQALHNSYDA